MSLSSVKKICLCTAMSITLSVSLGCAAQSNANKESKVVDMKCKNSAIEKSNALIHFMLEDIKKTYPHTGGGGISEIKQTQTNVYVVSIAQEERIDQLTYELSIDDNCKVTLVKKEESTVNYGR
ncbi:MAG TPA: hypothetical protein VLF09_07930 [Cellvibrio sp.]|nr:hypothetical protein [Cellvibrio sp.]